MLRVMSICRSAVGSELQIAVIPATHCRTTWTRRRSRGCTVASCVCAAVVTLLAGGAPRQVATCFGLVVRDHGQVTSQAARRVCREHRSCTQVFGGRRLAAEPSVPSLRALRGTVARAALPPEPLQTKMTAELIREQGQAGLTMKELGERLEQTEFEATALDGRARIIMNGLQRLTKVDLADDLLKSIGNRSDILSEALLAAMQTAHDKSVEGTREEIWQLYADNPALMQAPLVQIGTGNTAEDQWAKVTQDDETVRLATEIFEKFDVDGDEYWNRAEASAAQFATEGLEMGEDAYNALIIASAPDGGRHLSEEDLAKGLCKQQVIDLYTDADRQRRLGFVLDVRNDHRIVFAEQSPDEGVEAKASVSFAD
eukprot:TRINITY_DN20752_c0_g3_i1.p1 TRINITY_DN20752_c0_g3~~TRINITY_DN20752_c0_g3_i1.p1  ORF type:complete len:371 (-),score=60.68 TRINITY_DN20752_c0_g3_i1:93-1205(-)